MKELEDKNKNLYKFKYKYSNNLTDQEKQLYILERQKVYNNVFVFSYQLSSFVKAITEFATFNTYIIANPNNPNGIMVCNAILPLILNLYVL